MESKGLTAYSAKLTYLVVQLSEVKDFVTPLMSSYNQDNLPKWLWAVSPQKLGLTIDA